MAKKIKESGELSKQIVRQIASFLALERDCDAVRDYCVKALHVPQNSVDGAIKAARAELALAADVDVRAEIGLRKEQLEDLLQRARERDDLRIELATVQELSKLCGLYAGTSTVVDDQTEPPAVYLARQHLEALGITPQGLPIEELARLVCVAAFDSIRNSLTDENDEKKRLAPVRTRKRAKP